MSKLDIFIDALKWHATGNNGQPVSIYVWGAQGHSINGSGALTEADIRSMEVSKSYADQAIELYRKRKHIPGARAFDCSGLGCYLMECAGVVKKGFDTTADGLKSNCKTISRSQIVKGCFVFKTDSKGKAYHVGYVVDDKKNVVEAQGRKYGVVMRPLDAGGWNQYGIPKYFESEINNNNPGKWTVDRNLRLTTPYMSGDDVKGLQEALKAKGSKYAVTTITGKFGPQTKEKVIAFQKDFGLFVDGIAGENTIKKLGGKWV